MPHITSLTIQVEFRCRVHLNYLSNVFDLLQSGSIVHQALRYARHRFRAFRIALARLGISQTPDAHVADAVTMHDLHVRIVAGGAYRFRTESA